MNNIFGLLLTFLLGIFILLGACIALLTKNNKKLIELSIGMAFGVMIMLILTDLVPETIEKFGDLYNSFYKYALSMIGILIGVFFLKVFDIFIPDHDDKEKEENLEHIGIISTIALVLHNVIEGMAVYSIFSSDAKTSLLLSLGVGLHNLPLGMIIAVLLYKNKSKKKVILSILILSLSTFVGGIIMYALSSYISSFVLAIMIAITTGMIIYIVFFELLPKIIETKNRKASIIGILVGTILMVLSMLF